MQIRPKCNFKHEGPKGGTKRNADAAALFTTGGTKKARKKLVTLLVKDFKTTLLNASEAPYGGDEEKGDEQNNRDKGNERTVYEFIRGAPTAIITRTRRDAEEYRPKWLKKDDGKVMGYEEEPWDKMECSSPEETRFFVTLMMSGGDKEGDGYIPRETKKRGKEEASASDTS